MGKVIGVGGVFLNLKGDQKQLYDWYERYLGLDMTDYGTGFIDGEQLMILSLKRERDSEMPYLNFRVDDIESIVSNLKKQAVKLLTEIQDYDYGRFIRFTDPFGNQIELWEANPEEYRHMVKEEIKAYKKRKTHS